MKNLFDCEILTTPETIERGIAGFKGKIIERTKGALVVKVWNDFSSAWSEPQFVKPEEIKEL